MVSAIVVFFVVARDLGPAGYGVFAALQALAGILATLSSSAVVMFLMQEIVREQRPMDEVLPHALGLSAGAAVGVVAAATILGCLLVQPAPLFAIVAMPFAQAVGVGAVSIGAGALQASGSYAAAARVWFWYLLVRTGGIVALWATDTVTLNSVVSTIFVVALLSGGVALVYAARRLHQPLKLARPSVRDIRRSLSYSATVGAFSVTEDGDKTLMVKLAPSLDAGLYAAAYRVIAPILAPVRALQSASHTRFLETDPDHPGLHLKRALRYTAAAGAYGFAASAGLVLLAPFVMGLLGEGFEQAATVLRWLAAVVLLRSLGVFPFNALLGLRQNFLRTAILCAIAVASIAGNLVLIPRYSWKGAVFASIGCELLFVVMVWTTVVVYQRRSDRLLALRPV